MIPSNYELAHYAALSRLLAVLPTHVRQQAREAYRLFRQDPAHPGLRFKQVKSKPAIYSARVGISYRAVGVLVSR